MLHKIETLFSIETMGNVFDRVFSPSFDYRGERHDYMEFVYVVSGCVQVTENEKVYRLGSQDLILHGPMEFHRIKSVEDTFPHVINLSMLVRGELPQTLLDGVFHLSKEQHESFLRCVQLIKKLRPNDGDLRTRQLASAILTALMLELCQEQPLRNVLSEESGALLYKRLVRDMQKAIYENFSIESLAAQNFISVSDVKKLFRKYANMSPKHFYDDLRAREAALLLLDHVPVATVAEKMCFSSPNYFTLFFKKHYGMTPSEYKRGNET